MINDNCSLLFLNKYLLKFSLSPDTNPLLALAQYKKTAGRNTLPAVCFKRCPELIAEQHFLQQ